MATLMLKALGEELPRGAGGERCSSEELGEKQGTETPLGVLQEGDEYGREKPREAWIQLGFAQHGQTVEPQEALG